jgi:hypothetical protein
VPEQSSSSLSPGAIAGIAVGAVALVMIAIAAIWWLVRCQRGLRGQDSAHPVQYSPVAGGYSEKDGTPVGTPRQEPPLNERRV